ncbi:uncharacterized protein L201_001391 [Kwoniella dendrophila CBS 6074]|uniref:Uncharacterized protein n=1 Tax=Kwoniella dendrophila CBS 6074 TaxID=1295534 RepID=A0AAX4JP39_9TREE
MLITQYGSQYEVDLMSSLYIETRFHYEHPNWNKYWDRYSKKNWNEILIFNIAFKDRLEKEITGFLDSLVSYKENLNTIDIGSITGLYLDIDINTDTTKFKGSISKWIEKHISLNKLCINKLREDKF